MAITEACIAATLSLEDIQDIVGSPGRLPDSERERIRAAFARNVASRLQVSQGLHEAYASLAYDVGGVLLRLNDWAIKTAERARLRRELDMCAGSSGPRDGCRADPSGFSFCSRHNDQAHRDEINCPPTAPPNLLEIRAQLNKALAGVQKVKSERDLHRAAQDDGPILGPAKD